MGAGKGGSAVGEEGVVVIEVHARYLVLSTGCKIVAEKLSVEL